MFSRLNFQRFIKTSAIAASLPYFMKKYAYCEENTHQKDYSAIAIIPGTASVSLTQQICKNLGTQPTDVDIERFSDGEISISILNSIRGKHCFVVQSCSAPVNDNLMELLLLITAARRAGAESITAVIPYFGYKHNHRGFPISTSLHTRFLWSAAGDIAKMLHVLGVDKVVAIDLQRPGQGHEACFFNSPIPVETVSSNRAFLEYFKNEFDLKNPLVIVSPTTELQKKARNYQKMIKSAVPNDFPVNRAVFFSSQDNMAVPGHVRASQSTFLGDVKGCDVIIVEDFIDTGSSLSILCRRLMKEGAKRVFVFASHGIFSQNSVQLVELSPIEKVIVTDSMTLPKHCLSSKKIAQVSVSSLLSNVIASEIKHLVKVHHHHHNNHNNNSINTASTTTTTAHHSSSDLNNSMTTISTSTSSSSSSPSSSSLVTSIESNNNKDLTSSTPPTNNSSSNNNTLNSDNINNEAQQSSSSPAQPTSQEKELNGNNEEESEGDDFDEEEKKEELEEFEIEIE